MANLGDKHPLEWLARGGYAARGVVYVLIGWLALVAAAGAGGRTAGSKGALQSMLGEPFGKVVLAIIAAGLLGYVAWRATRAIRDTDDHGTDPKGLAVRGGLAVSAVTHTLLAIFTIGLIFGFGGSGGESGGTEDWTAWLMQKPFGQWMVALVGCAVAGAGFAHICKGWQAGFEEHLEWSSDEQRIGRPICRFGLVMRGIAFLIIGGFLIAAAWQADPNQARGLSGALQMLQEQFFGWALLGIMAVGLIAFGVYSLIESVYRKVEPEG